ncbi:MAG: phage tail tape measure protein [Candidatus Hodarchaeales archaeon]
MTTQAGRANASLKQQSGLLGSLVGRFGSVAKQAIAFGLISRPIYDLQRALTQSVKAAVKFEKEIVKISQITGQSVSQLSNLTNQINQLSTSLGVGANELAETARIIAQTGRTAQETEIILKALARSTLAPTFGKITDTTEGLVAALGQFNLRAADSEAVLGSLNKISKNFAVESEDLISAIRRTGGVFAQAAGQTKGTVGALQELSAIFTAVRSTTRESADTIAAGLRTIFSRIQRGRTIEFLKQFNVDLTDAKGNFVGIFPAFDQLSKRLDTLIKQGDALTLSAIAEELGGIRQIGKLLPAIAQFDKARKALEDAQQGAIEGLGTDVSKGLNTIDNRLKRVRESFNQLIRTVFESDAFQNFTKNILASAQSFLEFGNTLTNTLEPILPLLTTLGAFRIGAGLSGLLKGGVGGAVSSATGSTAGAQAAQKTAAATTAQNNLITNTNNLLSQISKQLSNLFQVNNAGFNQANRTLLTISAKTGSATGVGFAGGRRRAGGGSIPKFANGGRVYGPSHAAGGVIAELEGGEYVVPKKYARGQVVKAPPAGEVRKELSRLSGTAAIDVRKGTKIDSDLKSATLTALARTDQLADNSEYAATFLRPEGARQVFKGKSSRADLTTALKGLSPISSGLLGTGGGGAGKAVREIIDRYSKKNTYNITTGALLTPAAEQLEDTILRGVIGTVKSSAKQISSTLGFSSDPSVVAKSLKAANIDQVIGNIFESVLSFAGVPYGGGDADPPNAPIDFPRGLAGKVASKFGVPAKVPTESKTTFTEGALASLNKKVQNFNLDEAKKELFQVFKQFNDKISKSQITRLTGARNAEAGRGTLLRAGVATELSGSQFKFAASGGPIQKFNTGGEVPVRISNGEMVVSDPAEVAANKGSLQKINKLAAGGFASGYVAKGPGTGKSDSIYTTLPEGAFVVNAASTKKFLGRAKGGSVQRFANGMMSPLSASIVGGNSGIKNPLAAKIAEANIKTTTRTTQELEKLQAAITKATKAEDQKTVSTKKAAQADEKEAQSSRKAAIADDKESASSNKNAAVGGGFGNAAFGAVFALQSLISTTVDADSTFGKLTNSLSSTILTASLLGSLKPGPDSGFSKFFAQGGGAGRQALGGGTAALGGIVGGLIGNQVGNQIADAVVGERAKIGAFQGQSAGSDQDVRTRQALGVGGAAAGGAVAGAIVGSVVPVIGTAIGAAIGAAAGTVTGLIAEFGKKSAQSAFEIARNLQRSSETVDISFKKLSKNFTETNLGDFANKIDQQGTEVANKLGDLTFFLDESSLLLGEAGAELKTLQSLKDIIKPEDLAKAQDTLNKGFERVFDKLDLSTLTQFSDAESIDDFNLALSFAANTNSDYAKEVQKLSQAVSKQESLLKASELAQEGRLEEEQNAGRIIASLANDFDFTTGNLNRLNKLIDEEAQKRGLSGEDLNKSRGIILEYAEAQRDARETQLRTLVVNQEYNRLLRKTTQTVNAFGLALSELSQRLTRGLGQSIDQLSTFESRVNNILGGKGDISLASTSNLSNDEIISAIEKQTGTNLDSFRELSSLSTQFPSIVKDAVNSISAGANAQETAKAISNAISQRIGADPNAAFVGALTDKLGALITKRQQGEDASILVGKAVSSILEDADLDEISGLLGDLTQKQLETFKQIAKANDTLRQSFEKRVNFEIKRLKDNRTFEQQVLNLRIANEKRIADFFKTTAGKIGTSVTNLQRQLTALTGTSNISDIAAQRDAAKARQQELVALIDLNGILPEYQSELVSLGATIESTTEALNLFAKNTEILAAIQEEAARAQNNIKTSISGLDAVLNAAISGDPQQSQQILGQVSSLDRVLSGSGSLQDVAQTFQNASNPLIKALLQSRIGSAEGVDAFINGLRGQLAAGLRGGPFASIADELVASIGAQDNKLENLAQQANNLAQQQLTTLQTIQGQNEAAIAAEEGAVSPFTADVTLFSSAVKEFQQIIQNSSLFNQGGETPVQSSNGGPIYRRNGGVSNNALIGAFANRFSKGTDTIPAMLSPGEYVVRASAVNKVGIGALDAINSGNASVAQKAAGGVVYAYQGTYVPTGQPIKTPQQRDLEAREERQRLRDRAESLGITDKINFNQPNYAIAQQIVPFEKEREQQQREQARLRNQRQAEEEARQAKQDELRTTELADLFKTIVFTRDLLNNKKIDAQNFITKYFAPPVGYNGERTYVDQKDLINQVFTNNRGDQEFLHWTVDKRGSTIIPAIAQNKIINDEQQFIANGLRNLRTGQGDLDYKALLNDSYIRAPYLNGSLASQLQIGASPRQLQAFQRAFELDKFGGRAAIDKKRLDALQTLTNASLNAILDKIDQDPFYDGKWNISADGTAVPADKNSKKFGYTSNEIRNEQSRRVAIADKAAADKAFAARFDINDPQDLAFEERREAFFANPPARIKKLNQNINQLKGRINELKDKSKRNPDNDNLKNTIGQLEIRLAKITNLKNQVERRAAQKAGFGDDLDPIVNRLTDDEKQFQAQYNAFISSGLSLTGTRQDFANAEALFQQFLQGNSPNRNIIKRRIEFAKSKLFGDPAAAGPPRFHSGGYVGGFAKGGEVPIIAQEGEYVMSRQAVDSVGRGTMEAINKYHSGGLVQYRQTGGAASTGPIVTSTDVGQLQQVQSFNALAQVGEKEIGATNNVSTNVVDLTNKNSQKLDTLNNNLQGVIATLAIGFTKLSDKLSSVSSAVGGLGSDLTSIKTNTANTAASTDATTGDVNRILGVNTAILGAVGALGAGKLLGGLLGGLGGLFGGGKGGAKGVTITNIAQLQAVINTFGAVTNQIGGHMNTYGAVTNQLGTHMSTFGAAVNQFSTSINKIPEQIDINLGPIDIQGMDGFSQAVATRVVDILKNMGLDQGNQQNPPPPEPGAF